MCTDEPFEIGAWDDVGVHVVQVVGEFDMDACPSFRAASDRDDAELELLDLHRRSTARGTKIAIRRAGAAARPLQLRIASGGMNESNQPFEAFDEVETGEAFTLQNRRLLKVELAEGAVLAKNGAMVAYQGDVHFEHKGGGLGRFLKKAATGESLRLMQASGSGEVFLAHQAMLVHTLKLSGESITVNGRNILAFDQGIDWDVTRVKGGTAGMLAGGLFNIHLRGSGPVALISDGEPVRLDVGDAPTFADPQAAIAWSGGVKTNLKTDLQAKSLVGLGSGESIQLGFAGEGWVLVQPSEGRPVPTS